MRGEYSLVPNLIVLVTGSPPHAWGIPEKNKSGKAFVGITPICVGNTHNASEELLHLEDHPHMRGEYITISSTIDFSIGSPPHAWGIHFPALFFSDFIRITPTCVGNTITVVAGGILTMGSPPHAWGILSPKKVSDALSKDHPHMRGEYCKRHKPCNG